ncbi:universal stress protein UspA [Spiribacter roseus]|uniref:universal stress protein n=1 Tax=Spiribacter roseus TaxID=1855875 RepID=UPI000F6D27A3|nr:universal stress protein UspA [Spiribacter roseus]
MPRQPKILIVPVDGSEGASAAAEYALGLAQALDVPVRLLYAFPRDPVDMFGIPTEAPGPEELEYFSPEAFERLRDQSAEKAFAATREVLGETAVEIQEQIVSGHPAEAIVAHAAAEDQPQVVIGSRGLSGFKEFLLGSVSQRVLHQADCPVTVVR